MIKATAHDRPNWVVVGDVLYNGEMKPTNANQPDTSSLSLVKLCQPSVNAWSAGVDQILSDGKNLGLKLDVIGTSISDNPFYYETITGTSVSHAFAGVWAQILKQDREREHGQKLTEILAAARPWNKTAQKHFLSQLQREVQDARDSLYSLNMVMAVARKWGGARLERETAANMMVGVVGKAINNEDHLDVLDKMFKYAKKNAKCEIKEVATPWIGVWAKVIRVDTLTLSSIEVSRINYDRVLDRLVCLGADINAVNSNNQTALLNLGCQYNGRILENYIVEALISRGARWKDLLEDGVNREILDHPQVRSARLKEQLENIGRVKGSAKTKKPKLSI